MHAVPMIFGKVRMRWGRRQMQTAWRVVVPSAFSGITAAYISGISRAWERDNDCCFGGRQQATLTIDPRQPAATITAYIVQVSGGDLPHGSIGYQSFFAAGLTLLLITLVFNVSGYLLRKRYREVY